jgi:hypothetical protein
MIDERMERIERELELIRQRNAKVEADKAWETSGLRISAICAITYVVACALLAVIRVERFWLSALVPVLGFYLSAQSLPAIKKWWTKCHYQPKE